MNKQFAEYHILLQFGNTMHDWGRLLFENNKIGKDRSCEDSQWYSEQKTTDQAKHYRQMKTNVDWKNHIWNHHAND